MACYKIKITELKDRMKSVKSSYFQKELETEKYQAKLKKVYVKLKEMQTEEIDKKTYKKLLGKCDVIEEKLKEKYAKTKKRKDKDEKKKDDKKKDKKKDDELKKDLSTGSSDEKAKLAYTVENPEDITARG